MFILLCITIVALFVVTVKKKAVNPDLDLITCVKDGSKEFVYEVRLVSTHYKKLKSDNKQNVDQAVIDENKDKNIEAD